MCTVNTLTTPAPPPDTICLQRLWWINVFRGLIGYSLVRTYLYITYIGTGKGLVDKAVAD